FFLLLSYASARRIRSLFRRRNPIPVMRTMVLALALALVGATQDDPSTRGTARADGQRPKNFPHRVWAACDFEARTPDYAWFGPSETTNIPVYPGNTTALGVSEKPYQNFSGLMTGINPVP